RRVRQDNTIIYKSNRYSVPLGTYNKQRDVYISERDGYLYIYASENGLLIAKHKISNGKGQLIQDTQHTRDRSKGIDAFLETVASYFEDYELAKLYLEEIRTKYPRYVRDQLHMIFRTIKRAEQQEVIDRSLTACFQRKLFSATDFVDMVKYIEQQRQVYITKNDKQRNVPIKPLDVETESIFYITTPQRDLKEYLTVLEAETNE